VYSLIETYLNTGLPASPDSPFGPMIVPFTPSKGGSVTGGPGGPRSPL